MGPVETGEKRKRTTAAREEALRLVHALDLMVECTDRYTLGYLMQAAFRQAEVAFCETTEFAKWLIEPEEAGD